MDVCVINATSVFKETVRCGVRSVHEPYRLEGRYGEVVLSSIRTYGITIHTFAERKNYTGPFLPGFTAVTLAPLAPSTGLKYIDHCVGNVPLGEMDQWIRFYEEVMGFRPLVTFDDKEISTKYTSLMSKVVANDSG